ncbi:MAG TPA: L,D-transpeptidase family protein [Ornithinibacter sp.]|nr:L,D-transpeptidase family protein [Ornithinibacter sp.]
MGPTSSTRAALAAGWLTAAAVLLAGCGLGGSWTPSGDGSPAAAGSATSVAPPVTPTPTTDPTPTRSVTPTPTATSTPSPSATAKPTPTKTTTPRTSLIRGDSGPKVLALQQRLKALGYWLGTPDGSFGSLTQQAVWAFQKSAGLRRDGVVGPKTRKALEAGVRPKARLGGDGVEIDLDRQILLVVRDGTVRTILNTSTGNREEYTSTSGNRAIATTPRGSYTVYRAVDGPVTNSLGQLWRPRFFNRGIAVHGSQNIPPWPDSHGCARLSNAAIDMIWATDLMPIGSRVLVH